CRVLVSELIKELINFAQSNGFRQNGGMPNERELLPNRSSSQTVGYLVLPPPPALRGRGDRRRIDRRRPVARSCISGRQTQQRRCAAYSEDHRHSRNLNLRQRHPPSSQAKSESTAGEAF